MPKELEERVAHLEAEITWLKNKIENNSSSKPWWEQITGTFADNPTYDQAMRLGSEYRDSLRPISTEISQELYTSNAIPSLKTQESNSDIL